MLTLSHSLSITFLMKKLFLILTLLGSCFLVEAQDKPSTSENVESPKIKSDRMVLDDIGNFKCYGSVGLESERLTVIDADSVFINRENALYTIYGAKEYAFKSTIIITTETKDHYKLVYRVGDDFIKLE